MGSSQSIPSTSEITDTPLNVSNVKEYTASTKNGPKTKPMDQTNPISVTFEEESIADSDVSIVSAESDDDYSSDEEEADEYLAERRKILEEARQLREVAEYYYHPEAPVSSSMAAQCRCFFSRYSAPVVDPNEEEEREQILADAKNLKQLATDYMHPEKPVAVDATVCGRNYFTRPSAPEYEDEDMEEERELILEEMKQLKMTAGWYMHPEKPVEVDSTACGRNFFARPSAPEYEDDEEVDLHERDRILEEMKQLKMTAEWYMHPEKPVAVDSTACGRNYFSRPSAPEYDEDAAERELILEEMNQLKTTAEWYMHPEKPVAVDASACGRNYFSRPSAPEYDGEDMEERERILEEMQELKTTAEWYMHPEKPVTVDATSFGRNYFSRPSAPVNEDEEEREQILEDMVALKISAEHYMHPEKPVAVDSTACGRNFFFRPSAPEYEDEDMDEERERIMEDMKALKMTAEWYMHPEKPVTVDPTACGRNFFSRPSAFDDDAGAVAWEDQYLSLDFESNYTEEMEEERKRVLAEAKQLKEVASWYLQPEKPIVVDPASFGRNYFSRASAPEQEAVQDIEERELILSEVNELRMVAEWYHNPEKEVTVYATACGRNFFTRPSAPVEEDPEERERVLADAAELLRVAEWYMHPEKPVTVYATACGRNYFSRPSAPQEEENDEEMEEERLRILEDARQLKEVAGWYANPSQPVKSDGFATARNFFSRPSAPEYEEDPEERDQVLADAKELKEVAGWYANPDQPVKSDGFASARNYFTRPSAPEQEEDSDERDQILAEANELKEVASWYLQPEKPISVDPTSFGRNYFSRPSAEQATEGSEEERAQVLADGKELKNLAVDYLHPELPVARSSVNAARNFFDRPSAPGHAEHIHTEGYANLADLHGDYVQHDFDMHHADYDHHDMHHHDCDVSHQSFHSHGDHFDMDEDLHVFKESMTAFHDAVVGKQDHEHIPMIKEEGDGKEGNLSRSPSSIMLFDEQATV
jgi:hypothetical protein